MRAGLIIDAAWSRRPNARRCIARALVVALSSILTAAPASADEKGEAQALMTEGNDFAARGDFISAVERFRAAYARYRSPKILLNLGTSLRQLGRNAEAAEVYEQYMGDPQAEPARRDEVRAIVAEIDASIGRLRIELREPGARVRVDGRHVGQGSQQFELRVEPGEHTVVAEKQGMQPAVETVTLGRAETRTITLHFAPTGAAIHAPRAAAPAREGSDVGVTQRTVGVVVGATGLGALALGSVFGVLSKAKNDDAAGECWTETRCDLEGSQLGEAAKDYATVSTVAFVAGAAGLALGAVLFFSAPTPKHVSSSRRHSSRPFVTGVAW